MHWGELGRHRPAPEIDPASLAPTNRTLERLSFTIRREYNSSYPDQDGAIRSPDGIFSVWTSDNLANNPARLVVVTERLIDTADTVQIDRDYVIYEPNDRDFQLEIRYATHLDETDPRDRYRLYTDIGKQFRDSAQLDDTTPEAGVPTDNQSLFLSETLFVSELDMRDMHRRLQESFHPKSELSKQIRAYTMLRLGNKAFAAAILSVVGLNALSGVATAVEGFNHPNVVLENNSKDKLPNILAYLDSGVMILDMAAIGAVIADFNRKRKPKT